MEYKVYDIQLSLVSEVALKDVCYTGTFRSEEVSLKYGRVGMFGCLQRFIVLMASVCGKGLEEVDSFLQEHLLRQ